MANGNIKTISGTFLITKSLHKRFKDVRANCFCASLLRTQIRMPRHAWARALSNKINKW